MQAQSLGRKDPLEEGMQLTPVFLSGGSHGQRSLAGYNLWGCTELDMTREILYTGLHIYSAQFRSVIQSCLTLCDPMDCSTPGFPVHHQLLEFTQTHAH